MKDSVHYRLTIEDYDPSQVEDRPADVHGMPAETGHWWTDTNGRYVEGYEDGGVCGGCGWRPDDEDPGEAHIRSGLAATRYDNVFGRRPDPGTGRRPDEA